MKQIVVVMRGPSAIIIPRDNLLEVNRGDLLITVATQWIKRSDDVSAPGHLSIEIRGSSDNFEAAIASFANAGLAVNPILAVSANAAIGDVDVELAYEITAGQNEREYFQNYLPLETDVVHTGRILNPEATAALLTAITANSETARLLRAANRYGLALASWRLGRESLSLAHLWMALEARTKARIRTECVERRMKSETELADYLGVIDQREFETAVRRKLILRGDDECYRKARKASDGFEHGYLGYDEIHELSKEVRGRAARLIRKEILQLSGMDATQQEALLGSSFDEPMGHWPLVKYLRGHLVGNGEELALPGSAHPHMSWSTRITQCQPMEDGNVQMQFKDDLTAKIAPGIVFRPSSLQVWRPS